MFVKKVGVIGMGYVGIAEAVKSSMKYQTIGFQRNSETSGYKIKKLNAGEYPLDKDEPHIEHWLKRGLKTNMLEFSSNFDRIKECDVIIICVQTPFNSEKNIPDLSNLIDALRTTTANMKDNALVIIASTVPPNTTREISIYYCGKSFLLAHAPERVMPGKIWGNMHDKTRIIGGINKKSTEACEAFYKSLAIKTLSMTATEAEICKTAENGIRDIQIAIANQLSMYCQELGANYYNIKRGIDTLSSPGETRALLTPGFGVGGHCIPKDGLLLLSSKMPDTLGNPFLFKVARDVNSWMPYYIWDVTKRKLKKHGVEVDGSRIAVFGLSYIGNSADTRNSPTIPYKEIAEDRGANVFVYDPFVGCGEIPDSIDVVVVATGHEMFKEMITPETLNKFMVHNHTPILIDGRNIVDVEKFVDSGWDVWDIGRGDIG